MNPPPEKSIGVVCPVPTTFMVTEVLLPSARAAFEFIVKLLTLRATVPVLGTPPTPY